jgi:hypothetical protein
MSGVPQSLRVCCNAAQRRDVPQPVVSRCSNVAQVYCACAWPWRPSICCSNHAKSFFHCALLGALATSVAMMSRAFINSCEASAIWPRQLPEKGRPTTLAAFTPNRQVFQSDGQTPCGGSNSCSPTRSAICRSCQRWMLAAEIVRTAGCSYFQPASLSHACRSATCVFSHWVMD